MNDQNTFYLLVQTRFLDLLILGGLGAILGITRGVYGHDNIVMSSHIAGRMLKYGTLGFCAAFLWTLALAVDNTPHIITGEINHVIPFGPVMNLMILIIVSLWADEMLQGLIGSANKVVSLIQNQVIARLPGNGRNSKK